MEKEPQWNFLGQNIYFERENSQITAEKTSEVHFQEIFNKERAERKIFWMKRKTIFWQNNLPEKFKRLTAGNACFFLARILRLFRLKLFCHKN